ncbi:MAG: 4-fold beta flower protein [Candidatus Omnitrophota bacterium]
MNEFTFYDQSGYPIAYCDDGHHIYLFSGKPVAYILEDSVFSFEGHHLGWLHNGWVRDHNGDAVFFTENASGGILKPIPNPRPFKAFKEFLPFKGFRNFPPLKPLWSLEWGEHDNFFFSS